MTPPADVDVLFVLNYYVPYVSGLTEYARCVAEGLAQRGWRVRVLAIRHDRSLPLHEWAGGVEVVRTPMLARMGKGLISPTLPLAAARLARHARIVDMFLPMAEAGVISRLAGPTPLVVTYVCDVNLPASPVNALQVRLIDASSRSALRRARAVVPMSDDYADHSRLARRLRDRRTSIAAPCRDRGGGMPRFRDGDGLHVGFLGRIVEEKGLEYLVDGFRGLDDPGARLLIGGDFLRVAGGSTVDSLRRHIGDDARVRLLGFLPDEQVSDLHASIDVLALPSVNSLEAFGIVQVEAQMLGTPVIVSDLPGVRGPVRATGLGVIVPPRDAMAITRALRGFPGRHFDRDGGARRARELYSAGPIVDAYAALFDRVAGGGRNPAGARRTQV